MWIILFTWSCPPPCCAEVCPSEEPLEPSLVPEPWADSDPSWKMGLFLSLTSTLYSSSFSSFLLLSSPLYLSSLSFSLSSLCSTFCFFLLGTGCFYKLDKVFTCYQTEGRMKVMFISLHSQRHPIFRHDIHRSSLRFASQTSIWIGPQCFCSGDQPHLLLAAL